VSAITSVGTPALDIFLATKAQSTAAAVARLYYDLCFVYEFHYPAWGKAHRAIGLL
jgi:hypothetical protein